MNEREKQQRIQALDERRAQLAFPRQRQRIYLRRRLAMAFIIFGLIAMIIGQSFWSKVRLNEQEERLLSEAKTELSAAKEENQGLKDQVQRLQDEEYIANLARNELLFSKDGEIIFYFSPQE